MLSSRKTRFQWSKQDRGGDPSLFRSMAQNWRPPIRHRDPDHDVGIKPDPVEPEPTPPERPGWTPWLWVD